MKIYMSYWSKPNQNIWLNLWKLSVALVLKHYPSIELITDSEGYENLKSIPFSDYHICLDSVPNYPSIWSLGKIFAYKKACELEEPFLHLDSDVLLWEPLPENLLRSSMFCQSIDYYTMGGNVYDIDKLIEVTKCVVPNDWINNKNLITYNMGIFGGTNLNLINNYCDFVINMINDTKFYTLWNFDNYKKNNYTLLNSIPTLLEQGNFAIFCKNNNFIPNLLFQNPYDHKKHTYKKYTHLMRSKYNINYINAINERVKKQPYNLLPANVSIENW